MKRLSYPQITILTRLAAGDVLRWIDGPTPGAFWESYVDTCNLTSMFRLFRDRFVVRASGFITITDAGREALRISRLRMAS